MVINARSMLKNLVRGLSMSVYSHFGSVNCWNVHRSQKLKKTSKLFILELKIIQGHRCWHFY